MPNNLMQAIQAIREPSMRQLSVGDSIHTLGTEDPGLWSAIQRALNKRNKVNGTKDTIFDFLSDRGNNPVQMAQAGGGNDEWTPMQLGQAHYNHIAARGDFAREVPPDQRSDQDWKDIQNYIETFGSRDGWEDESRMMNNYLMGGGNGAQRGQSDEAWQGDMLRRIDELQRQIRQDQIDMDQKYRDLGLQDGKPSERGYYHGGPAPDPSGGKMYKWAPGPGDRSDAEPAHINAREDAMLGDLPDVPYPGTGRDDRIAMLTTRQQQLLRQYGGSGNINPQTGLREFDDGWGGDWGSSDDGSSGAGDWGGSGGPGAGDGNGGGAGGPGADDNGGGNGGYDAIGGDYNWNDPGNFPGGPGSDTWDSGGSGGGGNGGVGGDSTTDAEAMAAAGRGDKSGLTAAEQDAFKDTGAKTGSGGKETNMGLQDNPLGLAPTRGDKKEALSLLDSIKDFLNFDPDRRDKKGADPFAARDPSREGQKNMIGMLSVPGRALAELGGMMKDANLDYLGNLNYGKPYADLNTFEREEVDLQDQNMNRDGEFADGTYNDPVRGPVARPVAPGPTVPTFMDSELPKAWRDYFGNDFDVLSPYQLRTGAATHALFGPGAVFRTPEAQNYWRRLASETIDPLNPPQAIDYQYLTNVLGRSAPTGGTATDFLNALRY